MSESVVSAPARGTGLQISGVGELGFFYPILVCFPPPPFLRSYVLVHLSSNSVATGVESPLSPSRLWPHWVHLRKPSPGNTRPEAEGEARSLKGSQRT